MGLKYLRLRLYFWPYSFSTTYDPGVWWIFFGNSPGGGVTVAGFHALLCCITTLSPGINPVCYLCHNTAFVFFFCRFFFKRFLRFFGSPFCWSNRDNVGNVVLSLRDFGTSIVLCHRLLLFYMKTLPNMGIFLFHKVLHCLNSSFC